MDDKLKRMKRRQAGENKWLEECLQVNLKRNELVCTWGGGRDGCNAPKSSEMPR